MHGVLYGVLGYLFSSLSMVFHVGLGLVVFVKVFISYGVYRVLGEVRHLSSLASRGSRVVSLWLCFGSVFFLVCYGRGFCLRLRHVRGKEWGFGGVLVGKGFLADLGCYVFASSSGGANASFVGGLVLGLVANCSRLGDDLYGHIVRVFDEGLGGLRVATPSCLQLFFSLGSFAEFTFTTVLPNFTFTFTTFTFSDSDSLFTRRAFTFS